ncbi:hypothetical protein HS088_TW06G00964 [Tripterygium wilfordii]|uniref:Uncharacterized protein n=1 Tax=Tripterygium wilfordii TaxID=458696 RepID=A0A7J7DKJ2_TRIWF|nr:pinin-like [Tripterygium wilfordii]KAF5746789.1 hypothetical protein HS088_TW06G00964 [Tripterygium wilfordii]
MGNPKRPSNKDHVQCKKHPKHKQSPGICSLCLNEKLSKVSKTRSRRTIKRSSSSSSSSSSSLSSEYSSSSSLSSSYSSPMHHRHPYRFSTGGGGGKNNRGKNNVNALAKSRSLAFVQRRSGDDSCSDYKKKTTRRGGFWSKLLRPTRKKIDNGGLVHSSTL